MTGYGTTEKVEGEHTGGAGRVTNLRTVDLLEHLPHALDVVMVQEPCLRVLLILLKGYAERVGDVDCLSGVLPEEDTDYAFV